MPQNDEGGGWGHQDDEGEKISCYFFTVFEKSDIVNFLMKNRFLLFDERQAVSSLCASGYSAIADVAQW